MLIECRSCFVVAVSVGFDVDRRCSVVDLLRLSSCRHLLVAWSLVLELT